MWLSKKNNDLAFTSPSAGSRSPYFTDIMSPTTMSPTWTCNFCLYFMKTNSSCWFYFIAFWIVLFTWVILLLRITENVCSPSIRSWNHFNVNWGCWSFSVQMVKAFLFQDYSSFDVGNKDRKTGLLNSNNFHWIT